MLRPLGLTAILAGALVLLTAARADAYCRATTCTKGEGTECNPPEPDDCGKPLKWSANCLGFATQIDGSDHVGLSTARKTLRAAFATWEGAVCPSGDGPRFHVEDLGTVDCGEVEYNDKAGNVNTIVFRDKKWTHPDGTHNIALTTVTYDTETGNIYDADMELNSAIYPLTTTDITDQYDLLSVVTHEAGHFLGLGHSRTDAAATMNAIYAQGSTDFRTLEADDIAAICEVYPPTQKGPISSDCNPIPRHGFSPECLVDQTEGSCSAAPRSPSPSGSPWALACLLGSAAALARRRLAIRGRSGNRRP